MAKFEAAGKTGQIDVRQAQAGAEDTGIVKKLDAIIEEAVSEGATEIHLEPHHGRLGIRIRKKGVLQPVDIEIPEQFTSNVVNRVKVLSGERAGWTLYAEKLVYVKGEGTEAYLSCDVLGKFFRDEFGWEEVDIYQAYHEYKEQDREERRQSLNRQVDNFNKSRQQVEEFRKNK